MNKKIFGYDFNIEFNGICENLMSELQFYPDIKTKDRNLNKVNLRFIDYEDKEFLSSNPSLIKLYKSGFSLNYDYGEIHWDLSELDNNILNVSLRVKHRKSNLLRKGVSRFRSMGYETFPENIGQIVHELVFIPTTFFFQDKVIIHGSCLYNKKFNKSIIFGGTGGVGKTSSLLELGKNNDWVFLSDDMVVVDEEGFIYPNYAFPKVYAYNTIDDKSLEKNILYNLSFFNKMQWKFKKIKNKASVRRRISPDNLYNTCQIETKLNKNLFLFRGNFTDNIKLEKIDNVRSAELEEKIIIPEYESIYKYIRWYEYNSKALGIDAKITIDGLLKNYREKYQKIFLKSDNYIVKINSKMNHIAFKKKMIEETISLISGDEEKNGR